MSIRRVPLPGIARELSQDRSSSLALSRRVAGIAGKVLHGGLFLGARITVCLRGKRYAENTRAMTISMPVSRIRLDRQPAQVGSQAAHDSRFPYVLITLSSLAECRAGDNFCRQSRYLNGWRLNWLSKECWKGINR